MIFIYCLFDPRNGYPFYVGATCYKLNHRLSNHVNEKKTYSAERWSEKMIFIRELEKVGIRPQIKLLYTASIDTVDHYEAFFHAVLTRQGYKLLQKPHAFSYKNTRKNSRYVSKYKQLRSYNRIYFKNILIIIW